MLWFCGKNHQALVIGLWVVAGGFFACEEGKAAGSRLFQRSPSSFNRGGFVGLNQGNNNETNFRNLEKRINNQFLIDNAGRLGVREVRPDGVRQDLFLDAFGTLRGQFFRPQPQTVRSLNQFLSQNADRFNLGGRVQRFVAQQSSNPQGVFGRMTIDLSSIIPEGPDELKEEDKKDPAKVLLHKQRTPGTPEQIQYALATLNQTLNAISNSGTLIRVRPQSIRRDRDGKPIVTVNLGRFFSSGVLATMAASDPTFSCTGKIRLQSLVNTVFDPETYYRLKGLEGFNRNQIFDFLGVDGDKRDTVRNKILVASERGSGKVESGVTTSPIGRVSKFLNQRRFPGLTCYETDDFIERPAPGEQTNVRDVRQVGPFYQHDASEVLCHQPNGYMLGLLFDKAGALQKTAPSDIARGGKLTGPTVASAVACLDCHAKGFLAGGEKIHQGLDERYRDNLGEIPPVATAFRDRFGNTLNWRDFFTSNRNYRNRADRDSFIYWRALARSGGLIPFPEGDKKNRFYPQAVIPYAVAQFAKALTAKDMARELGADPSLVAGIFGGESGTVDRRTFENGFCSARARLGAGNALAGVGRRQPTPGAVPTGLRHNANGT